jgi:hypothetical protein
MDTEMGKKVKPLSASTITEQKLSSIPDEIIESVNALILNRWTGLKAQIMQKEIVEEYVRLKKNVGDERESQDIRDEIFKKHWLDIEEIYRQEGWDVKYDRPGFDENYEAFFVFTKKHV